MDPETKQLYHEAAANNLAKIRDTWPELWACRQAANVINRQQPEKGKADE